MHVLVLNCGSSSLKFQVIETDRDRITQNTDRVLIRGLIERIGSQALITMNPVGSSQQKMAQPIRDHQAAVDYIIRWLINENHGIESIKSLNDIDAVGHRVVHGGEKFRQSVLIDKQVIQGIEDCIELAPLHNPANLLGIKSITELIGGMIPQVAVFDTAFHARMPEDSYLYAIPYQFYRRYKIRRYGFHGTSHRYIAYRYREIKQLEKKNVKIITLHLGNGCSACAINSGLSQNTSMGMTPLEGLIMGTRAGDLDPAILEYLHLKEGFNFDHLDTMLNKQSGLLGISGLTNDMRELLEEEADNQDRRATLAIDMFCKRVRGYIGLYIAELNGVDAICFSGGIGENSSAIRERICMNMDQLGIQLDSVINKSIGIGTEGKISSNDSKIEVYVIPTNEELLIARDTVRSIKS